MASRQQWGNITWYLFHGIAEKIKEDEFSKNKDLIVNIIKLVCHNLPCPECGEHATKLLNNVNFNLIKNKNDLKQFLFSFHNTINIKTKKSEFKIEELDKKYKTILMPIIFNNFFKIYSINNKSEKMMMYTAFKNNFFKLLKKYLIEISKYLDK